MSGVFGIADPLRQINARFLADKMANAMSHREWFVADRFVDDSSNLALGRIDIGILNKASQPVWNSARTVALVMVGESYDWDALGLVDTQSDEEMALALYEKLGDDFVDRLNEAFLGRHWLGQAGYWMIGKFYGCVKNG